MKTMKPIVVCLVAALLCSCQCSDTLSAVSDELSSAVTAEVSNPEFEKAQLVRVVDGDTVIVKLDGEEQRVRLIGVNTPESVAPESSGKENTPEGAAASEYTKSLLGDVKAVYLQRDTSEVDRYDRLLRYVWLEIPKDKTDINEITNKMLNAILLRDDVAEVTIYEPDDMYESEFRQIAEEE